MKDLDLFVCHMSEQFLDTDPQLFEPETKFKELDEWSSLMALAVIAMVDDTYHVRLKGADIRESVTIEDLYKKVKALL